MKFCKNLQRVVDISDPEWAPYWVNYKMLKVRAVERTSDRAGRSPSSTTGGPRGSGFAGCHLRRYGLISTLSFLSSSLDAKRSLCLFNVAFQVESCSPAEDHGGPFSGRVRASLSSTTLLSPPPYRNLLRSYLRLFLRTRQVIAGEQTRLNLRTTMKIPRPSSSMATERLSMASRK